MSNNVLQNTIVLLIGFAGTGKYTIGRELCERTGAKLIDNHLINNPIFKVTNADGVTPRIGDRVRGEIEQPPGDDHWPLVRWHLDQEPS